MSKTIIELRNLGPSSAEALAKISITNREQLEEKGALACYETLCQQDGFKPSFNFLYAMLGAIENKHWTEYKKQKGELLLILESNDSIRSELNLK